MPRSIPVHVSLSKHVILVVIVISAIATSQTVVAGPPGKKQSVERIRNRAVRAAALVRQGDKHFRRDDYGRACGFYAKAIAVLPSWWMPRLAVVRCGRIIGLSPKFLLKHARFAVKSRPQITLTHMEYGHVLEELERRVEAVRAYQAALRLDPDRGDIRIRLGTLQGRIGKPHLKAAERHLSAGLAVNPRHMAARLALARVYEGLGLLKKAGLQYRVLVKRTLYPAKALARLIRFYERHKMTQRAKEARRRYIKRYR
jgi:tetratricopeptide (TPR) repeat protein